MNGIKIRKWVVSLKLAFWGGITHVHSAHVQKRGYFWTKMTKGRIQKKEKKINGIFR